MSVSLADVSIVSRDSCFFKDPLTSSSLSSSVKDSRGTSLSTESTSFVGKIDSGSSFSSFPSVEKKSNSLLKRLSNSSSVPHPSGFPQGPNCSESPSIASGPLSVGRSFSFSLPFFSLCFPFFSFLLFPDDSEEDTSSKDPNVLAMSDAKLLISWAVLGSTELGAGLSLTYSSDIWRRFAISAFTSSLVLNFFLTFGLARTFCSDPFPWSRNLLLMLSSRSKCPSPSNSTRLGACPCLGVRYLLLMSFTLGITSISSPNGIDLGTGSSSFSLIFFLISDSFGMYSKLSSASVGLTGVSWEALIKFFLMSDTPWLKRYSSLNLPTPESTWSCGLGCNSSEPVDVWCSPWSPTDFSWSGSLKEDVDEWMEGLPTPSIDSLLTKRRRDCMYFHSCSFS